MSDKSNDSSRTSTHGLQRASSDSGAVRDTDVRANDGGPAFPSMGHSHSLAPGLTKREWFAGMALMGFCANPGFTQTSETSISDMAERQSDAMIARMGDTND